jgi:hypothetical protein
MPTETVIFPVTLETESGTVSIDHNGNFKYIAPLGKWAYLYESRMLVSVTKAYAQQSARVKELESQLAAAQPAVEAMEFMEECGLGLVSKMVGKSPSWTVNGPFGNTITTSGEWTPQAALLAAKAHMDKEKGK